MREFAKGLNCVKGLNYRMFYISFFKFIILIFSFIIFFYNPPENIYYTYEFEEEKNKFPKKKINIILTLRQSLFFDTFCEN